MLVCLELMLLTEAWSSAALYISAIVVMDPGKCIAVSDNKLNCQVDKLTMRISSSIDVLGPKQCEALEINGKLGLSRTHSDRPQSICTSTLATAILPRKPCLAEKGL
ncbi:hypothetical protein BVRB_016380 isoform A [Beta vulgaris subsp. vulgaris]|uniref:Secreted protein n=1 Tax=Beta vulgaris subsp. vulgaris TaxID=3555 RepID=A0A0J8B112_BETVV|nr:hypothetical protein BVRB_016380 isoform A [Beta vulgaris subsp. vulgaris]